MSREFLLEYRGTQKIGITKSMNKPKPFRVLLDANIWVAERLLQSAIGSALLYALTGAKASILLPEVVELEVNRVLPGMAEKAVTIIGREASLLRQLSGQNLLFTGPSAAAIGDGIKDRWKKLDGLLIRAPFTHDQAKSALDRVIQKTPPSGENNEQFRDCCIWEAAMSAEADSTVHLITGDNAFYEGRKRDAGLASVLASEARRANKDIRIYPALKDFLSAMGESVPAIDEKSIADAILGATVSRANEIIAKMKDHFELGSPRKPKISSYATPKPSLVAISFEITFDLKLGGEPQDAEDEAELSLKGVCSYDPNNNQVSEIEVREWSTHLKGRGQGWRGTYSPDQEAIERQYGPSRMRIITG
jgi:hypothetical protein